MHLPNIVWLGLGHLCVVVGIAGVLLPVLPGVPFFILAAICYSKGSRKFFIKLVRHKKAGPPIRRWLRHGTIPRKAKGIAVGGMAIGAGFSVFFAPYLWLQISIGCLISLAALYVLTRPSNVPA
jgi:uncharacterized membrane protein YbaN (DUF454 family)